MACSDKTKQRIFPYVRQHEGHIGSEEGESLVIELTLQLLSYFEVYMYIYAARNQQLQVDKEGGFHVQPVRPSTAGKGDTWRKG